MFYLELNWKNILTIFVTLCKLIWSIVKPSAFLNVLYNKPYILDISPSGSLILVVSRPMPFYRHEKLMLNLFLQHLVFRFHFLVSD